MYKKPIKESLSFFYKEIFAFSNLLIALAVGMGTNMVQGKGVFESIAPYLAAFLILAFVRVYFKKRNHRLEVFSQLSSHRPDPSFMLDPEGKIILSAGLSESNFQERKIPSLSALFDEKDCEEIANAVSEAPDSGAVDCYSSAAAKWYRVRFKKISDPERILVWLDDVTEQKMLELSLSTIRSFSSEIMDSIDSLARNNDSYERFCRLVFKEGYEGLFLIREDNNGKLSGQACKADDDRLCMSGTITIDHESRAPVLKAKRSKRIVSASREPGESQEEFEARHPFDRRVKAFLGSPIYNYVNYHEGDVSIIAFNRVGGVSSLDISVMETLVNSVRSITTLIDLAQENDEKFLQMITGLCAAAEYSDEITGKHILRVNEYAKLVASHLSKPQEFVERIGKVAALHDIGKVAIPEIIKLKRNLNASEIRRMQMHTIFGAQILDRMIALSANSDPRLAMARDIALHHHQCWDGTGYPRIFDGNGAIVDLRSKDYRDYENWKPAKGEQIPPEALIVSLADKYDALRHSRSYKPALSHSKTCDLLEKDDRTGFSGKNIFGDEIFEVFMSIKDDFEKIYGSMRDE